MTPHIKKLTALMEDAATQAEKDRIQKLIDRATTDAQKANERSRKMAQEIADIKERQRKADRQRKIVAGAIALTHMEHDEEFSDMMTRALRRQTENRYKFHFPEVFTAEEIEAANAEVQAQRNKAAAARAKKRLQDVSGGRPAIGNDDDNPA